MQLGVRTTTADAEGEIIDTRPVDTYPDAQLDAVLSDYGAAAVKTGFLGRVGIYEMLRFSSGLKGLVKVDCDLNMLRRQAYKDGMRPLRLSAAQKVAAGSTTLEEALKVVPKIPLS